MARKPRDEEAGPTRPLTLSLTDPKRARLDELAAALGESRSVVVERLIAGATDEWVARTIKRKDTPS